ncbi:MAG: hypothetical protein JST12_06310 [Armatimonadetes bacterium]|nr:hypothetical protein [Armatimonadota bacterium]
MSATTSKLLRPHAPGETSDAAIFLYRRSFSAIANLSLLPSLFISGFAVVFFELLFPRLFETRYQNDTSSQILEFTLYLFGGLTAGFIVATIGLAKVATYAHVLVEAEVKNEEINQVEIERRARPYFGLAYKTMLRTVWYTLSIAFLSVIPLIVSGLLVGITGEGNVIPGILGILSIFFIPVGIIWSLTRLNIGLGAISVALNENKSPKEAIERAKYLFGSKSKPAPKANPAASAIGSTFLIYLLLRVGYSSAMAAIGIQDWVRNAMPSPYLKVIADIVLGILPEFLAIWLVTPFVAIAAALFYYQRRICVEGLDISILYEKLPSSRR